MDTIGSLFIEDITQQMKISQIKWKLLLFDETDFVRLRSVYFCSLRAILFILSQIKKDIFFNIKPDYQIVRP